MIINDLGFAVTNVQAFFHFCYFVYIGRRTIFVADLTCYAVSYETA